MLARLSKKAKAAGLDKRIHAHGFRHSHAHLLRKQGLDMCLIQKQLGHANLAVASVYLDHVGANELAEAIGGLDLSF